MSDSHVVLITGTSSGIGKITAERLATRGFKVYGGSRSNQDSRDFQSLEMDVTCTRSVKETVAQIMNNEGKIDSLINNAGISMVSSVEDISIETVSQIMETNFLGTVRVSKAVLPHMRVRNSGKIINISSIGGFAGLPYRSIYSASKYAVEGFTEALRLEVEKFGIEACTLQLGSVHTDIKSNREENLTTESPYFQEGSKVARQFNREVDRGLAPEKVSKKIEQLLHRTRLKPRYRVANAYQKTFGFLIRPIPSTVIEWLLRRHYKL